jgi:uncharacterized protein YkwD
MRMRKVCFILAVCSSSLSLAAEMPEVKSGDQQGAVKEAANQVEPAPLHRHPTMLAMLRRSNLIRRAVGLHPQRINPALTKAAQDHANYMAATGQFSHYINGGYQYRAQKYGFKGGVRENIAAGFRTVDAAFNTWHASGGHYASIVSDTSEAGFGYAIAPSGATYWVGVYGSPAEGDEAGEDEGFAEKAAEMANAEAGKKAAETKTTAGQSEAAPKTESPAKAETPVEKIPAASGM